MMNDLIRFIIDETERKARELKEQNPDITFWAAINRGGVTFHRTDNFRIDCASTVFMEWDYLHRHNLKVKEQIVEAINRAAAAPGSASTVSNLKT